MECPMVDDEAEPVMPTRERRRAGKATVPKKCERCGSGAAPSGRYLVGHPKLGAFVGWLCLGCQEQLAGTGHSRDLVQALEEAV